MLWMISFAIQIDILLFEKFFKMLNTPIMNSLC
jgi:hypothetical protein